MQKAVYSFKREIFILTIGKDKKVISLLFIALVIAIMITLLMMIVTNTSLPWYVFLGIVFAMQPILVDQILKPLLVELDKISINETHDKHSSLIKRYYRK